MLILGSGLECFEQLLEDMLTLTNQWSICIDNISLKINFPKADNIILDIQGKKRHLAAYGRSAQWNIVKKKLTLSLSANLLSLKHFKAMTITNSPTILKKLRYWAVTWDY